MKVFLVSLAVQFLLLFISKITIHSMSDTEKLNAALRGRYPYRVCVFIILWLLSIIECFVAFIVWIVNL